MESLRQSSAILLEEETQIALARRAAAAIATRLGFSEESVGRAELVCVELARNVIRHAQRGSIYVAETVAGDAVQIVAADKGPGIGNIQRAMEDGFSTSTTPGLGLGAVHRMARKLDVYSRPGAGTVISAVVSERELSRRTPDERAAVLSTCIAGETVNGDSWAMVRTPVRELYMLVDGLGHGLYASEAAQMASSVMHAALRSDPKISLTALVTRMHGVMRATRGAAIAFISVEGNVATACGVGNISTILHGADGVPRAMLSHNGTLGHQMRRVQEFTVPVESGTMLVMHSDGIATHWKMSQYPGLLQCAPATVAGVLFRDAVRGRDDATILVARLEALGVANG